MPPARSSERATLQALANPAAADSTHEERSLVEDLDVGRRPRERHPVLARLALKEGLILLVRTIAATYGCAEARPPQSDEEPGIAATRLVNHLVQQLAHAPLELTQAIGRTHEQGLPLLQGGHLTALERRFRQALREATSSAPVADRDGARRRRPHGVHLGVARAALI